MNNVYLSGKIIEISDVCFDYYNGSKPYIIFDVLDNLDEVDGGRVSKDIEINKNNLFKTLLYTLKFDSFLK